MLHPQVAVAAAIRRRPPGDVLAADPQTQLEFIRQAIVDAVDAECGPALPLPVVADLDAGGVPCRLYAKSVNAPVFVYVHGGGWTFGSVETVDRFCRRIADRSGCAVLSVEYRLAPEHPHPAALEDVEAVLRYVRTHGAELAVDPTRLAVGGDSSGAQIATVAVRRARDAAMPVDYQVLINPALDPMTAAESFAEYGSYGLDRQAMQLAWAAYVPDAAQRYSPDVAPLAVADLSGMPPTLVLTAEYDVLRDEGADYADALLAAGVPVVHVRYAGVNHGFVRKLAVFDAARVATDQIAAALRSALTF